MWSGAHRRNEKKYDQNMSILLLPEGWIFNKWYYLENILSYTFWISTSKSIQYFLLKNIKFIRQMVLLMAPSVEKNGRSRPLNIRQSHILHFMYIFLLSEGRMLNKWYYLENIVMVHKGNAFLKRNAKDLFHLKNH